MFFAIAEVLPPARNRSTEPLAQGFGTIGELRLDVADIMQLKERFVDSDGPTRLASWSWIPNSHRQAEQRGIKSDDARTQLLEFCVSLQIIKRRIRVRL
jgi:hypothetical protein